MDGGVTANYSNKNQNHDPIWNGAECFRASRSANHEGAYQIVKKFMAFGAHAYLINKQRSDVWNDDEAKY